MSHSNASTSDRRRSFRSRACDRRAASDAAANRPNRSNASRDDRIADSAATSARPVPPADLPLRRRFDLWALVKVIAGTALLIALSWEIIGGDHVHFSGAYLWIQFIVCLIFLCDFFIRMLLAERRSRFFWIHLPYLLISIPWLNLLDWGGMTVTHDWGLLVGLIPMLRAFLAMTIIVEWMVSQKNRLGRIFWAYIFTVVVFTYLSALVFYDYEVGVNAKLTGFGNALWWAWMNVTTVGAEIFAVTGIGKVVTVLLPSLGMMFFPIFTTYILDRYTGRRTQF